MNYYEILGVAPTATAEEIKKAYRKRSFETHPDRNEGNPAAADEFKSVAAAYACLSNPERRRVYDMPGNDFTETFFQKFASQFGASPEFHGFGQVMFGAPVGVLRLTLQDLLHGGEKPVNAAFEVACSDCGNSGVDINAKPEGACGSCQGQGSRDFSSPRQGTVKIMCADCHGAGQKYPTCKVCNGSGTKLFSTTENIKFPSGLRPDTVIQVAIKGHHVPIAVHCHIPEGIELGPQGRVTQELFVDYPILVDGGSVEVALLDGSKRRIKLPAAFNGKVIRLQGQGLPISPKRTERGDLFLSVRVKMPSQQLLGSAEHKELIGQLKQLYERGVMEEKVETT